MCYSPALRQDRVTGPGWGRDGKANGEDFLQEEEEGKSECVWEKGKVDCDEEWPCQGLVGREVWSVRVCLHPTPREVKGTRVPLYLSRQRC